MLHAWRKFGLAAAAREHFEKYRGVTKRGHGGRGEAAFRNIVYGQIAYVKMVRGASDPLFLKLCAGLLELDPNPSRFLRQMVFGADNYDVFISHASEDKPTIARPIFEACASYGVKAFLDEEHIGWGQNFATKINTALGASRTVLAVVSNASVTKEWPLLEINTALALEVSGAKRVLPLIVGRPDLARLPLIRSKKWLVWDGDPAKVAAALKELVRPPPAVPKRGPVSSVPIIRVVPAAMPRPPKASRGWLSRLWRRDPD